MTVTSTSRNRRDISIWILGCLALSLAVAGYAYHSRLYSPESRLRQAREPSVQPVHALALVRSGIYAAKGNFPAAQVFECRLLLKLQRGPEAKGLFKRIRHLEECDPEELCELAELASSAGEIDLSIQAFFAAGDEFIHRNPQRLKQLIL
jgi:hypothetical protein